jgi:hypothetical protein
MFAEHTYLASDSCDLILQCLHTYICVCVCVLGGGGGVFVYIYIELSHCKDTTVKKVHLLGQI